jgi:hypothetical protein
MRFSSLTFRVTLLFAACTSFLAVCESARSKASLQGAVLVSERLVYSVPFKPSTVKKQVAPTPARTVLRRQDASSAVRITNKMGTLGGGGASF